MSLNRYAKCRDANEAKIVSALESIGCTVQRLDKPVDLLVGRAGKNYLLEVKNPDGKNRVTPGQDTFLAMWKGQVSIVRTAEEAIREVMK